MGQLRTTAAVLVCTACRTQPAPVPPSAPAPMLVEWVKDGPWHYCELSLTLPEVGQGRFSSACRGEEGPLIPGGGVLGSSETFALRQLIAEAGLFGDKSQGQDMRGLNFPLITLRVKDGDRFAEVVCSLNPTFDTGARFHLVRAMLALEQRTGQGA